MFWTGSVIFHSILRHLPIGGFWTGVMAAYAHCDLNKTFLAPCERCCRISLVAVALNHITLCALSQTAKLNGQRIVYDV